MEHNVYPGEFNNDYFHSIAMQPEPSPGFWPNGDSHGQHYLPDSQYPIEPPVQQSAKKRKTSAGVGDVPGFLHDYNENAEADMEEVDVFEPESGGTQEVGRGAPRRVCDMINILASRENSLKFDAATEVFTVLDGDLFQKEFVALKASKGKKSEASDRVFAQMYRTYQIVHGERWGAAGTVFKAKKLDTPLPTISGRGMASPPVESSSASSPDHRPQFDVSRSTSASTPVQNQLVTADSVAIWITEPDGSKSQISLQQFLDVTGAGQLYSTAIAQGKAYDQVNGPIAWMQQESRRCAPLNQQDLSEVVGGLWNASSKGDQAYFFKRKEGMARAANGAIVGLVGGELAPSKEVAQKGGLYMVVSDDNAKWKGEPLPTPAEEPLGHWCCFLGQVPVCVSGSVKCGDHIGPRADDGAAVVTVLGKGPVVGTALQDKLDPAPGIVKVMCFAGLNAVSSGSTPADGQYKPLLDKALALEAKVDKLDRNVKVLDSRVDAVEGNVAGTTGRVEALEREVGMMSKVFTVFGREDGVSTKTQISLFVGLIVLIAVIVTVAVVFTQRKSGHHDSPPHPLPTVPEGECLPPGFAPPPEPGDPCYSDDLEPVGPSSGPP